MLAGSSIPLTDDDVQMLIISGFGAIISLEKTKDAVDKKFEDAKVSRHYLPISMNAEMEFNEVGAQEMQEAAIFALDAIRARKKVLIHCRTGMRRTQYVGRQIKILLASWI